MEDIMTRYIALLRGINISGKNKINMAELKAGFIEWGYADVTTCLNSGNVIFSSDEFDEKVLASKIMANIKSRFKMEFVVIVISQVALKEILDNAPSWWGTSDKGIYDNLIFVSPLITAESIADKIGEPTKDLEKIEIYKQVIFWSFDRLKYAKSNWWKKTASVGIGEMITIRSANTLRKILDI